ncbi:MAG TPA: radical SAM protein [Phycisphaerae bacterium]|nr:radical SAM protein [Phycisphaerae bacterium]
MHAMIIQFIDPRQGDPRPEFSHTLGVLGAMLKQEGFPAVLTPLTGFQPDRVHQAVIEHRPQQVLVDLSPYSATAARRTIADIAARYVLPVVVFGDLATARPADSVSMPGVHAMAIGEYEHSVVELLRALRDGAGPAVVPGIWMKTESGLVRSEVRPLHEDLDALPFPDRELFDYHRTVAATGEAGFQVARGCPLWCGYCLNDWYMDLYEGRGEFVRRRTVENVLAEIDQVRRRYDGVRKLCFYDHCFATDLAWLQRFAAQYPRRVGLPYRCHVRLKCVSPEVARVLAGSGCREVRTLIASGSRFIREEVQSVHITDKQIVEAVRNLQAAGLRVVADVFVGSPYESEITIADTLALVRRAAPDEIRPRVFYPCPGTRAAEICADNGWISGRGEEDYWRQRSVLDMRSLPARRIDEIAHKFLALLNRRPRPSLGKILNKVLWSRSPRRSKPDARRRAPDP